LQVSKRLVALGAATAILISACGGSSATTAPSAAAWKACVAFDTGGLGDKGFNDLAKKGLDAAGTAGYATAYSEAKGSTDYAANIQRLLDQKCQTIIAVGFNQQKSVQDAAIANPKVDFGLIDATWDSSGADGKTGTSDDVKQAANFTGLDFQIDQAAMLAGYLSAGWSKTGKMGTYGGQQFPGVTRFMDGYYAGIAYYNKENGTKVQLLGWDAVKQTGTFVNGDNPWNDSAKGESLAGGFVDQGADVLGPVAGSTGNGSIKFMLSKNLWAIGVDTDQAVSLSQYAGAILTSAQKVIDAAVLDTIKANASGQAGGGNYVGTLTNGGVALAPFHNFDSQVPQKLKDGIKALQGKLVDGSVKVADYLK